MDSSPEKSVMTRGERKRGEQLLHATERVLLPLSSTSGLKQCDVTDVVSCYLKR